MHVGEPPDGVTTSGNASDDATTNRERERETSIWSVWFMNRTFVGFGFGAIQGGLFLYEAFRSGNFDRLVVAEVMPNVVDAVRSAGGVYQVNIALSSGVECQAVSGVEILNSTVDGDADKLIEAIVEASEIATALPSVDFFNKGNKTVAQLIAEGLRLRHKRAVDKGCVVYTGENNNYAAEVLREHVVAELGDAAEVVLRNVQFLNTVIGKMSGIVADAKQIERSGLELIAPELDRAFLVEEFNKILISLIELPDFERGIDVFVEKADLHPFEEAKLYGHNATHALVGYLAYQKGYKTMSEALADVELRNMAREAFMYESGSSLIMKYAGIDTLFTVDGFKEYVDDLIVRMANPNLEDLVERIIRDPERKLGWDDRLIGTMRLAVDAGIEPKYFAKGAAAALRFLNSDTTPDNAEEVLLKLWQNNGNIKGATDKIIKLITKSLN